MKVFVIYSQTYIMVANGFRQEVLGRVTILRKGLSEKQ